ncbi:NAD-dependent epimerase/dehydratase family protein [Flammeovirga kamogawensis]|uniref:NAD-dependent epimerase/dehydratase family protein n=1 Tax=Flammeovirga kamogawensis TaxID=373891 RepID=A0ABX8H043_9BACT|nr:NAD-dependent epimerase/dehydratase family protein [Flammeovirga kamogawensis]MBB6459223.1 dihydroflavonol-4-reductase [Flammeovirga kamogawensis]QWG08787.1 NAD-dependent epimerase/dehydratase family protein [Flammeovirga kamogawensis]TRX67077.1 NAD-dependent epimerase/dehydratase family protein [Flammeovirga kamogawensis]
MIALTGATGHVGYVLHKFLLKENMPHKVLVRKQTNRLQEVDQIVGDLGNTTALQDLVRSATTVIHSAGIVYPRYGKNDDVLKVNYHQSKLLFEEAKKAGVKHFIFISSIHSMEVPSRTKVFDETAKLVVDENKSYDFSKAEMERYLSDQKDIKITILNPTSIIGGGDLYFNGFNQLFKLLHSYRLPMLTSGGFDIIDVKDIAKCCIIAARKEIEGKFILGNTYYSIPAIAKLYGTTANKMVSPIKLSTFGMVILAKATDIVDNFLKNPLPTNSYAMDTLLESENPISHQKAVDKLGYLPTPIQESLQDVYKWIENGEFEI